MATTKRVRISFAQRTYSGVLLALWLAAQCAFAADTSHLTQSVMEFTLSGTDSGEMLVVLRGPQGELYLEEGDFERLRLHLPKTAPLLFEGRRFFDPRAIKGCSVNIDERLQRAIISAPTASFDTTHLSAAERRSPEITPASPGAFLNYQLSAQQIGGRNLGGAYAELGVFAGAGVLTNTAVARYGSADKQLVRLDTTYTRDFPATLETLNLGDAISDGASWGNAVRYAGVRWSRNFGLRPDLLTTPLLATSGSATVPSTVDVFVNNQLVTSNQLPPGPFVIDRLPTVSGTGDVSVVVRDALGREQVVTQSFYSSTILLAQGLSQYSVNLGKIRADYTLQSNDYGPLLGEVSYRRGITDRITLEGHAEYLAREARAAGLNAAFAVGRIGVINFTAAAGGDAAGSGWLRGVGIEHRGTNTSFIASNLWASNEFSQVGEPLNPALRMRQRSLLQTGMRLGRLGSLSLAYVRQTYRDSPVQQTLGLTHSISFGRIGSLNLTLTRTRTASDLSSSAQSSTSAYLIFVLPLERRRAATVAVVGGSGSGAPGNELIASLAQSPPVGPGSGYRLSASTAGNYDADWRQQFHSADLELEVARNRGLEGRSAYLSGAMTLLDGQLNTTRSVNGSFAMVDVAGLSDVPVYVENQLTTHTDASGRALLYNLRPYEANRISITPEDLPLDTSIGASSTIMAPPFRSGVIARFPVERVRSGTFRLVLDTGKPVPVGAVVSLRGGQFPVVQNGTVYVTGYDHGMAAQASWPGGHCSFRLEPPPSDDPLPDMGTVVCHTSGDAPGTQ
ncbi:MAG: fimbria/pilus outer membrane usher protein [Pseudomonadota bacterium]|nr:fimbria/pilus outer membrane usher protein [Pseudomonadota bacterium]